MIAEWRVKRDKANRWFWHMIAANGQVIFTSGQAFASQGDAKRACEDAMARSARAPLKVEDPHAAMNEAIRRALERPSQPSPASALASMLSRWEK
jgi:uncharacterized protein YegP (UPF0339 family)